MAAAITFRQRLINGIAENPCNELLMEISSSSRRRISGRSASDVSGVQLPPVRRHYRAADADSTSIPSDAALQALSAATELRFYVPRDTKYVISDSEKFLLVNPLA